MKDKKKGKRAKKNESEKKGRKGRKEGRKAVRQKDKREQTRANKLRLFFLYGSLPVRTRIDNTTWVRKTVRHVHIRTYVRTCRFVVLFLCALGTTCENLAV